MRAIQFDNTGGPEVLYIGNVSRPVAGPGELLIRVQAAGVNRPDISQRLGRYPVPRDASPILGLEVAGIVEQVSEGHSQYQPGDRVMALVHGGGYAEFCRVDCRHVMPVPDTLTIEEAAAFPEVALTVEFNMVERAGLRPGETVLIHGGSSGIGSYAARRALSLGATVITTSRGPEKAKFCRMLGVSFAIDATAEDWSQAAINHTHGSGVDVIVDMVGGAYTDRNLKCLAEDGRYALISLQGGSKVEIDLDPVLRRRLTLVGSTLRPLSADAKATIVDRVTRDVLPNLATRQLVPHVHAVLPLGRAADAHGLLEQTAHFGKIVLTTSPAAPSALAVTSAESHS